MATLVPVIISSLNWMFPGVYAQLTKLGICAVSWHAFHYPNKLHPKLTGWCRNKPLGPL